MQKLLTLTFALTLSACSTLNLQRGVARSDIAQAKEVGVISILGDDLGESYVGATVFNNRAFSIPVPDWKIDDFVNQVAFDSLSQSRTFHTTKISRDAGSVESYYKNPGSDWIDIPKLTDIAKEKHIDTLVVIRRTAGQFNPMGGYGISKKAPLGISMGNPCAYTHFFIEVVQVSTGENLAWNNSEFSCPRQLTGVTDISENLTPAQLDEIKTAVKASLQQRVPKVLRSMNLSE